MIFRDKMLPSSETFILSQGEGLPTFQAVYLGARKVEGLELPADRSFFVNNGGWHGRCRELLFKLSGPPGWWLSLHLAKLKPRLVHAHFGPDGVLVLPWARACRLPLVVTFHGYDATSTDEFFGSSCFVHKKYLRQRKELIRYGSRFIAVSQFVKDNIVAQGFPEEKIVVHYVGVDLRLFHPRPEVPRKPVVLFVGRLAEVKGCSYLIKAMREVQGSCPEVELVVIGAGPLREQLEQEAAQTLRRYRFLGDQPPGVVREWLSQAKVFSVPSITTEAGQAEAFGMVFIEAQAMGVPVATFASGGIPEAVAHGETGLLAPEKDWQALALNIKRLLSDTELWQQMSGQGQKRVRDRFDLERQSGVLEGIYTDALRGGARGTAS